MSRYYRRREPGSKENAGAALAALGVAAGAAVVTFYFVRIMLSREPLSGSDQTRLPSQGGKALPAPSHDNGAKG